MQTKIAIFVEGQSEQIFLREILLRLFLYDVNLLSFECVKLHAGKNEKAHYPFGNSKTSKIHFLILNVENDEKVLREIRDQEKNMFKKGYSKIIGLRDMYSGMYERKSKQINDEISKRLIENCNSEIKKMSMPNKISFHFAIMELEAWWLSMFTLFEKIDSSLTVDAINEKFGFKLDEIDPEKYFFHPYPELKSILKSVGKSYNKKEGDVESVISHFTLQDIETGISNDRCNSLRVFYEEIKSYRLSTS